jgi:hypothetical protein
MGSGRISEKYKEDLCAEAFLEIASFCGHGCVHGAGGGESIYRRVEAELIVKQNAGRDEGR